VSGLEGEVYIGLGRVGAMFRRKENALVLSTQEEAGVRPGVEFTGAAKGLARADAASALSCVVDHGDGEVMAALEVAQEGKEGDHGSRDILVYTVEPHKGV